MAAPLCYNGPMPRPRYAKGEKVELVPDAWERFERAIAAIGKAKPIHRPAKSKRKARARRVPRAKS